VIGRYRALVELALAGAALVGAGVCWSHASQPRGVAPVAEGQPYTTSLVYDPQLLLLTMLLAIIAGLFAVAGAARLLRSRALSAR
jgi:NO-binding membrane sensor protein with MHYT domain